VEDIEMADGALRYEDLSPETRAALEALFSAPKVQEKQPGKEQNTGINPNDPKQHLTQEEMEALGVDPKDLSGKWQNLPGVKELPPRALPVPQVPRDTFGPRMSLGGPKMDQDTGMSGGFDLGSLLSPPSETPTGQKAGTWTEYLQDPVARSALLSFGLQALTGGWGGPGQQMAAAIGAGAEGAAGTAKQIQGAETERLALDEKEKDRKNRLDAAKIAADSRAEVANIRSEAMLQRAAMIRGPTTDTEIKAYKEAYNKYYTTEKNNAAISANPKTDLEIMTNADIYAKNVLAGMRQIGGSPGGGGPMHLGAPGAGAGAGAGSEVTLPNLGAGAVSPQGGGAVPPGKAAAGAKVRTLADALKDPKLKAVLEPKLQSNEGIAAIEAARPDWKGELQYYKNREVIPNFIKNLFNPSSKPEPLGGAG
jgi:hypothetical protein